MNKLVERFLKYVSFDTQSDPESETCPSTRKQLELAKHLERECTELGLKDVKLDEFGYVYATLPSNTDKNIGTIGFIAHMDTSDDCSGKDIKPRIVKNYDGGDIELSKGIIMSPSEFPSLRTHTGKDLIVTDGTTLLGADDKAGIAEIMTAVEYLILHPEIKHGDIKIGFTPDEEIGRGANKFDVAGFNAEFAYTLDGSAEGVYEVETFNAASAKITINGKSVHPGSAKGIMINSAELAAEIIGAIPENEKPSTTEHREGFYHLSDVRGACEKTQLSYILRDHDKDKLNAKKDFMLDLVLEKNKKYGEGRFTINIVDQYSNMKEILDNHPYVVSLMVNAIEKTGLKAESEPVRGGTDGARLSFMGLPCPNIFTGGYNFHGPYEYACIQTMEKASEVIVNIASGHALKQ